ncbi:MAG: sugar ABC transporter permease [Roseburia sp.]|nr:sugar ABC transporter permease [Roseburia sp.]
MKFPKKSPANSLRKKPRFIHLLGKEIRKNYILYIMIAPVVAYYIIFHYWPLYGLQIAFKDFIPKQGFWRSPWVGFKHFERFFSGYNFWTLIGNTLKLSIYGLLASFPIPIFFALLLNYLPGKKFGKLVQMVSYAPNFISMVVLCGMVKIFFFPETGVINQIIMALGGESVDFLSRPKFYRSLFVWSGVWQTMGFSAVMYISALSGVDYEMHEAAIIDGASKWQRIRYVDLPSIKPTIIIMLIFALGGIMGVDYQKSLLLQNSLNMPVSDVLSTYVYRVGLLDSDYGYSTAVGLFNSVCNVILLLTSNAIVKKKTSTGLW